MTLIIVLTSLGCFAQAQLTETEYNYITKGIQIQMESGLDVKKGYSIKDLFVFPDMAPGVVRSTTFKAIYRDTEKKPFAYLCIYKNVSNGFTDYICFPVNDATGIFNAKANQVLSEYDEKGKLAIIWGLFQLSIHNSNSINK